MQQISRCPNCGSDNAYGQKFCGTCGTPLASGCPNCGAEIDAGSRFCGNCGAQLPADIQPAASDMQQPGWGPPPPQPAGWGQPQGGLQQQGWTQQPPPPPQQGWGQQPAPPPQQPPVWNQPPAGTQQQGWGQQPPRWEQQSGPWRQSEPRGNMGTILIVVLILLLAGLGTFGYFAFFSDSPPWAGLSSSSSTISINSGPFITVVSDNTTTDVTMKVTWESNKLAVGRIEYGTDDSYGEITEWETDYKKSHEVTLADLPRNSSYHYRIIMKGQKGAEVTSGDKSFKTPQ